MTILRNLLLLVFMIFISCTLPSGEMTTVKQGDTYYTGKNLYEGRKRVVIIDTGLMPAALENDYMCKDVAQTRRNAKTQPTHAHGINIVSIVTQDMDVDNYCITMITIEVDPLGRILTKGLHKEFNLAINLPRTYAVSMSFGLSNYSRDFHLDVKRATQRGIFINASAGNQGLNLDIVCNTYPACYSKLLRSELRTNLTVVGALAYYSNHGSVVDVFLEGDVLGFPPMRGTSQATALYTNMLVRR